MFNYSSFFVFLALNFINAENLILTNGENRLIIKKGEEMIIQYQNKDTVLTNTGEFLKIDNEQIIFKKFDGYFLNQEKKYTNISKASLYSTIKIDINNIISIKSKVAPRPSLEKVKDYARKFGLAGGIASTGYIILVGNWSDAIGIFIGVIVTPIVGLVGAVGGAAGGALLATILHYNKFSTIKEYRLADDNWKIQIQT